MDHHLADEDRGQESAGDQAQHSDRIFRERPGREPGGRSEEGDRPDLRHAERPSMRPRRFG
jgi:hypothetical protein